MSAAFLSPRLPIPSRTRRRPRAPPRCGTPAPPGTPRESAPQDTSQRISRRAFALSLSLLPLLPLPALAFPDIDPSTGARDAERAAGADDLMHPRAQRYGMTEGAHGTHATHADYLRASHVATPPNAARTAAARASVVAFAAAFTAFGMAVSERESLRNPLPRAYDRDAVARYFQLRPDKVVMRMALFAREFTAFGVRWGCDAAQAWVDWLAVRNAVRAPEWAAERDEERGSRRARLLREAITRLGTAVIKLGQAAASRQDLLGVDVIRELQKLQDDILDSFPTVEAFAVIQAELGATPQKLFQDISLVPVAGASLGMVFKARVDDTVVAVKVQRPEVAENVALDCYIVRWMASTATFVLRSRTDLAAAVDEYASRLYEELDYLIELENMDKFRKLYGDMDKIYLPKAFPDYCSRRVLVTEWVEGFKLVDDDARVRPEDLGLVKTGIRFALTQLLDKGFLHADMHNGNMLRTKSGYLAYIDFGLVSYVPVPVRESLVCALMQLIHGEYTQLAQSFAGLALMNTDDLEVDLPLLSEALRSALEPTNTSSDFTLVGIVGKLLSLSTRFRFVFNDYFLNNLRCLGMLEGLGLAADADFSILQVVYPFVANKLLTECGSSPRFDKTLSTLVIDAYGRMRWSRMEQLLLDSGAPGALPDALARHLTSAQGHFVRSYLSRELAGALRSRGERAIDRVLARGASGRAVTRREAEDGDSGARVGRSLRGTGARGVLLGARLLPVLLPALAGAVVRLVRYAVDAVARRAKPRDRTAVATRDWRAFDSRFLRRSRDR